MHVKKAVSWLRKRASKKNKKGMARFGINTKRAFGVSVPKIRKLAKMIGKNQKLSLELWKTGIHEARLLAGFVGEPEKVSERQMEEWVKGFDSWDVCDQVCSSLFDKTPFAYIKANEWSKRKGEFVKRAGFALMACLAVHDKNAPNKAFESFFPIIAREPTDRRNFVKKAVNWALRQIGKRNLALNRKAVGVCKEIAKIDSKSAKWIAADALRELEGKAVQKRLKT